MDNTFMLGKKEINLKGVTPIVWARTIVMIIALVQMWLIELHQNPLPETITNLTAEQIEGYIRKLFETFTMLMVWWKNHPFSISAQDGDAVMKSLEEGEIPYVEKAHQPDTDHHHEVG